VIGQTEFTITHAANATGALYILTDAQATYLSRDCSPQNLRIFFQDVIMRVILIKIGLHLLKVALVFCLKYCYRYVCITL